MYKLFIFLIFIFFPFFSFSQQFEGIITYKFSSFSKGFKNNPEKQDGLNRIIFRYYFKYPYIIEELETQKGEKIIRTIHDEKQKRTISYCKDVVCWDKKIDTSKNTTLPDNIKKLNDTIIQNTYVCVFSVKNKTREEIQTFWIDKTKYQNIQFPIAQAFDTDKDDFTVFNEHIKGLPLRIEMPIPLPKEIKTMMASYSKNPPKTTTFLVFELKNIEKKELDEKFFDQAKKAFSK